MAFLEPLTVEEAMELIVDRAKELLVAAQATGEPLEGITIVRGDRSRGEAKYPAVWMVPDTMTIDTTTMGLAELWNLPIILGAIVKNTDDVDAGYMEANKLASRAMQVLLGRDRRWGLGIIEHVKATRFDPTSPRTTNDKRSLFWADAVVQVTFRRLEP